ncbi:hypothetical protein I4U23_013648 [Adineta vaga]|nr:hypothetical protein I4U23_013648 [Adineta vaga]
MSCVNIGQLLTGLLIRILITGFGIDLTVQSIFYCKFRQYIRQVCALISLTCLCFATLDQYLTTCSRVRWQKWSSIKIARRLCAITILFWILHSIPTFLYFNIVQSTITGRLICILTDARYSLYFTYVYITIFTGYLPVFICTLFGLLAYYNVRRLAYRTVPLVRRELDKQLTIMVLILDIYNFIALIPYPIILVLTLVTSITQNPVIAQQINFVSDLTSYTYFSYFACPFYIYICTSERFRRQLHHVLFKVYLEKRRRQKQITPFELKVFEETRC